ncbi:hypothetical protein QBC38DRAFT_439009 [Podospora fimiseda]|uniref:G-patch domain-containing protein n=1 Tax=Podospora fimiseda TaxID=252190 RepID=A0AAN7H5E2_9PEZI|nr:hypothetical protein QBC38DRAFT_439009 [Podospora fimiseda]
MSYKRSRAAYESDLTAQKSPFVLFGTPLPPLDPDVRDDGSYVPVWKQEVRDERGRKRLHGAFTGGFSAGYFNTVGSKEGWTPSTFVSSRTNRRKDDKNAAQQRPEDFMDEEDLADAEEERRIQTKAAFAGLGSTENDASRISGLMGLFRAGGETMGVKLLQKMGWKEGQGIGPKVRRKARLDLRSDANDANETHLFAPENVPMISFVRKTDHKGLGFAGQTRLTPLGLQAKNHQSDDDDDEDMGGFGKPKFSLGVGRKKPKEKPRGGIGIGILNDTGSDDEDPYEVGPKISYNRVIGGDKKKKKATTATNPTLKAKPTFIPSRKSAVGKVGLGVRKCHDGRLPLDGFVFGKEPDPLTSSINDQGKYPPPKIPPDWVSSKKPKSQAEQVGVAGYVSTADAAKTSALDPKSRADILGEKQLPGKSVFDFLSPAARERLVAVTGKSDLPQAKGEVPAGYAVSEEERMQDLLSRVPQLGKEAAVAAISRGMGVGAPYADDDNKRARYIAFLEYQAGFKQTAGNIPPKMSNDDWLRELNEFYNCARIFRPMTGSMASRFTTSTSLSKPGESNEAVFKPPPKPQDPAEEAAKLGMFGPMTRSVEDFYPTRLLCKRFNVKPPAHVQPDDEGSTTTTIKKKDFGGFDLYSESVHVPVRQALEFVSGSGTGTPEPTTHQTTVIVDSTRNEALEGKRAAQEVFNAIFGDKTVTLSDSTNSSCSSFGSVPRNRHSVEEEADAVAESELVCFTDEVDAELVRTRPSAAADDNLLPPRQLSPPPQYPASEASASGSNFRPPPSFSDLFDVEASPSGTSSTAAPAYAPSHNQVAASQFQDETKRALPQDTKGPGESSSRNSKKDEDAEPPPAYSEGYSPLPSFTFLMAATGGASSIITQVQQGGPPINTLGDVGADETITMDLRGTRFTLSRDELLTLPEFVLLSLFPNGLFPEGHMGSFQEGDAVQVDVGISHSNVISHYPADEDDEFLSFTYSDLYPFCTQYDPASLQYMLDFFRNVAQTIPTDSNASLDGNDGVVPLDPGSRGDDGSRRAGIIVLREDLDFYAIPHKKDIDQPEMIEVKRAAARALLKQNGIFSGLKKSDEPGTTEAHLIEMLTAGGFNHDDSWGHRAGEPNKAVICSLALARLRSDIRGNDMNSPAVGMAQKLLLFWRKPARRCWWEGVELEGVEGIPEGQKLKVWIRRVWTLEMSVIGLR